MICSYYLSSSCCVIDGVTVSVTDGVTVSDVVTMQ